MDDGRELEVTRKNGSGKEILQSNLGNVIWGETQLIKNYDVL